MKNWSAQVNVKWSKEVPADWSWLKDWKEVRWAWSTTGEWDMTLWVDVENPQDLEKFVHGKLRAKDWVGNTESHWVKEVWHAA